MDVCGYWLQSSLQLFLVLIGCLSLRLSHLSPTHLNFSCVKCLELTFVVIWCHINRDWLTNAFEFTLVKNITQIFIFFCKWITITFQWLNILSSLYKVRERNVLLLFTRLTDMMITVIWQWFFIHPNSTLSISLSTRQYLQLVWQFIVAIYYCNSIKIKYSVLSFFIYFQNAIFIVHL